MKKIKVTDIPTKELDYNSRHIVEYNGALYRSKVVSAPKTISTNNLLIVTDQQQQSTNSYIVLEVFAYNHGGFPNHLLIRLWSWSSGAFPTMSVSQLDTTSENTVSVEVNSEGFICCRITSKRTNVSAFRVERILGSWGFELIANH